MGQTARGTKPAKEHENHVLPSSILDIGIMALIRNTAWAAATAALSAGSRFALCAILARRLTQDAFGQFAYAQWLVDLSFLLCSLGAGGAASRYLSEFRHKPSERAAFMQRWLPFAIGLPLLAAAAAVFGAFLSDLALTSKTLVLLSAWALANGLWAMQTAALVGLQRFDLVFRGNLIYATVVVPGSLFIDINKVDPSTVLALLAAASTLATLVGLDLSIQLNEISRSPRTHYPWRSVARYAINVWLSGLIASLVWSRGEVPTVKLLLGDAAVAHYTAALVIFGAAVQGMMLGASSVATHLTQLWGEGKRGEAITLSRLVMDLQLLACSFGSLFMIFYGRLVISLVFTAEYEPAVLPLSIFCIGLVSFAVSSQSQLLQLETNATFNRNSLILGAVTLYVLALALIPVLGLVGAAVARAAAMTFLSLATIRFTVKMWGRRSVSVGNLAATFALITVAALIDMGAPKATVIERTIGFSVCITLATIAIRNEVGKIVLLTLAGRIRRQTS